MNESIELRLYFDGHLVGHLHDGYYSDNTWYGEFDPSAMLQSEPSLQRVREYYDFSKSWNERSHTGAQPSAAEFRAFQDITASKKWTAETIMLGESIELDGAPQFWEDGFIGFSELLHTQEGEKHRNSRQEMAPQSGSESGSTDVRKADDIDAIDPRQLHFPFDPE